MAKLFGSRKRGAADDEMTIGSAMSMGGASVSDRIMGRMRRNLSISRMGANSSSSSVATGGSRRARSSGRSGRNRGSDDQPTSRSSSVGGRASSRSKSRSRIRSMSAGRRGGVGGVLERMAGGPVADSIAPKRSPSAPTPRPGHKEDRFGRLRKSGASKVRGSEKAPKPDPDEPIECSLADLRAMTEAQLKMTMLNAGISSDEISESIDNAVEIDASVETIAVDQRKNKLVALFVNSGRVKLTRQDTKKGSRPTLSASTKSVKMEDVSLRDDSASPNMTHLNSDLASVKSTGSSTIKSKKTKLEKILELRTENSQVKRENKSLKKTVKKLLNKMVEIEAKVALAEKQKEQVEDKLKQGERQQTNNEDGVNGTETEFADCTENDEGESSMSPEENATHDRGLPQAPAKIPDAAPEIPPSDSFNSLDDVSKTPTTATDTITDCKSIETSETDNMTKSTARKMARRRSSGFSEGGLTLDSQLTNKNKELVYWKRKFKKEREAHQNTAFRLKAEIDFLSTEVSGLQRELALSLEVVEDAERRAHEAKEINTSLKQKLRSASTKVAELRDEAEARDRLIDTFAMILLQKSGMEGLVNAEEAEGLDGGKQMDHGSGLRIMGQVKT